MRDRQVLPTHLLWTWFVDNPRPRFEAVMIKAAICVVVFALAIDRALFADPSPTPTPDKSQYTLFNPTPIDLRRPYNTDRPSKTDSPFTIDAGVFQIESDVGTGRSITKKAYAPAPGSSATRTSNSA